MGIVRFALKFPYTFYTVAAFIVFLGGSAIRVMPEDIFPEINIPVVSVIWQYTGLSVPEMEQRVTTYGQYAISTSVNGIKNMEAQTLNGISVQKIYFQPDVNLDLAISQIVAATNAIRALMPPGIQAPIVVGFVADDDATRGQQLLHHAQTEREAEIQPNGVADDLGWESIAGVAGGSGCRHPTRLPFPARPRKPPRRSKLTVP